MSVVVGLIVIAIAVALSLLRRRVVPSEGDVAWLAGPQFSDPSALDHSEALDVCRRYLSRLAAQRFAGGAFGVLFATIVGLRWYGSVSVGIGQGNPLADLLFCGLAGVIIGALSAESFRLGSDRADQRAASLTPRNTNTAPQRLGLARGVALTAVALGLLAGATGHGWVALATALILVGPFAVAERVRVVIEGRSRPVMSDRARLLDERLRSFAASSVSFLQLATAALMLGWTLSKIDDLTGVIAVGRFCAVLGCLFVALVALRRSAPRRPRGVPDDSVDQSGAVIAGQSTET